MSLYIHESTPFADVDPDFVVRTWREREPIRSARFSMPKEPGMFAVLHPSTKRPGIWQLSYFDAGGAVGDAEFRTLREALRELPPSLWVLDRERL
jgi:hypothetical protein